MAITITGIVAAGFVSLPYHASLSAVGVSGSASWFVVAGALPPGLSLDPVTGEIVGTPTTAGTYTFTVEAFADADTGIAAFVLPIVPPGPILAFHTFGFDRIWFSFRRAPGTWTLNGLYADWTDAGGFYGMADSISSGVEGLCPPTNPRGVIALGQDGSYTGPFYFGSGRPARAYPVIVDNIDRSTYALANLDYWDVSHGAWTIGGELWAVIQYASRTVRRLAVIRAIEFDVDGIPTLWHAEDLAHNPVCASSPYSIAALRWDGLSTKIDFWVNAGGGRTTYSLYTFDTVAKTWTQYGVLDWGRVVYPADQNTANGFNSNGLYHFPNDDIGVVYTATNDSSHSVLYYRKWDHATATWGAELIIKDYGVDLFVKLGQVLPDPGKESLHVFATIVDSEGNHPYGEYHIAHHDGTVVRDCFTFPTRTATDGFGHGVIYDNQILIPYDEDGLSSAPNSVWVGTITGGATTFLEEALPKPDIEAGQFPSCAYLIGTQWAPVPPPPSSPFSILPQYIKRRNLFAH